MSDYDDDEMMYDDDDYDYDDYDEGEYDDEEEEGVEIENQYYNSKGLIEDSIPEAIEGYLKVMELEAGEKGEWGFKALKKVVKLSFEIGEHNKAVEKYQEFLTYIKSAVTSNVSEKGINSILDSVSGQPLEIVQQLYEYTLAALLANKNERVWFRVNLKQGKLLFDKAEYQKLAKILRDLHRSCELEDGSDDQKKGSQLIDIYALEIQMYTETKDNKKLKELYAKALNVKSAIPHPKIMGIIRECGGKMHMSEKEWILAYNDFFEAFKNYDEAGVSRRIQCLKYLVLANMLSGSRINPFDATEAKPYKNSAEILAMLNLVMAYEKDDIRAFEKILKDDSKSILEDAFIRMYVEDLLKNIRTQVLVALLKPYNKITIPYVSNELNIPSKDVEDLLVGLILDNKVRGKIDQVNQELHVEGTMGANHYKYDALSKWSKRLGTLGGTVIAKVA